MAVNYTAPQAEDLLPVAGVRIGVAEAGIRKANRKDVLVVRIADGAAVAGVFAGLTVQLRPNMGVELLLPLFAAVILGGVGSIWGAVLGGLIVGLAESASVTLVGAEYRSAAAFAVLIAILMVRPKGLFGEQH